MNYKFHGNIDFHMKLSQNLELRICGIDCAATDEGAGCWIVPKIDDTLLIGERDSLMTRVARQRKEGSW